MLLKILNKIGRGTMKLQLCESSQWSFTQNFIIFSSSDLLAFIHYVRPSFTVSRLSRRNFSWSSHYSKSLSGYWMNFQLAGLQWLTVLSMLIRGITITLTGDWHIADWPPYLLLSCYVTLCWPRVKFDIFLSCECDDSPKLCFNS